MVEEKLGGSCYCCGATILSDGAGLHAHHLSYPNGKLSWYTRQLEALQNPDNFRLLCGGCHRTVTRVLDPKVGPKILEVVEGSRMRP